MVRRREAQNQELLAKVWREFVVLYSIPRVEIKIVKKRSNKMISRLQMKNGVRRAFTLATLLVGSAFLLNDSAMAVSTRPAPVPEVSSGWVLLPVVLTVLLFSSRQIFCRRPAQKS